MCNYKKSWKRIKQLTNLISGSKIIETKLGKRLIKLKYNRDDKSYILTYYDKDDTILFSVVFFKDDMQIAESKISDTDIFNAIYEAERILNTEEIERVSKIALAQMFGRWYL